MKNSILNTAINCAFPKTAIHGLDASFIRVATFLQSAVYSRVKNCFISLSLILLFAAPVNFAMASQQDANVTNELAISAQCCPSGGINYCDRSAGHYVCKTGGYSTCVCTQQAAVSAYKQYPMGCCTWHGGVAASTWGQVVCNDGSLSEICSIQSTSLNL